MLKWNTTFQHIFFPDSYKLEETDWTMLCCAMSSAFPKTTVPFTSLHQGRVSTPCPDLTCGLLHEKGKGFTVSQNIVSRQLYPSYGMIGQGAKLSFPFLVVRNERIWAVDWCAVCGYQPMYWWLRCLCKDHQWFKPLTGQISRYRPFQQYGFQYRD